MTYENVVFAALFQINHNILTAIITIFSQKRNKYTTTHCTLTNLEIRAHTLCKKLLCVKCLDIK